MNRSPASSLHCFPCGGPRFGWGGGRKPLPIEAVIRAAHGKVTVVSLRHACLTAGLLEDVRRGSPVSWTVLGDLVRRKWNGSVEHFLKDASGIGVSLHAADRCAEGLLGAIIGWTAGDEQVSQPVGGSFGIIPDINLSLAILGRRTSDVFVASRLPDYSWDALFANGFECDDRIGDAPGLREKPWSGFEWSRGAEAKKRARVAP